MENAKKIYIIISIICVLSIVLGAYAQFFGKRDSKTSDIPTNNTTDENVIENPVQPEKEKTMEELKNEFDGYILRFVSYHIKQIVSVSKFKQICQKKLSPLQNQMLNERYNANSKLIPIIEALLAKKIKTEFQKFI